MREAWERVTARGPGWYWVANQTRNGDAYHACSLARAFIETHGSKLPIYYIAAGVAQVQVAELYRENFAELILEPHLPQERSAWEAFFDESGLPQFAPGSPILLHPTVNAATCALDRFSAENGLNWMQLYKHLLRLPAGTVPAAPPVRAEVVKRANQYCQEQGLVQGKSAILFPYAQSLRADGLEHFGALAAELKAGGLKVFTSVSVNEQAASGTTPIFIPFSMLREVAEYAGWVIAVRSGICDLTSSAKCRKTFIYRSGRERALWSVNRMDLARDAAEEVFSFVWQTHEAFRDLVCRRASLPFPRFRRPLSAYFESTTAHLTSVGFQQIETRGAEPNGIAALESANATVVRIHDIPSREDRRCDGVAQEVLSRLLPLGGPLSTRIYALRDDGGEFDFFEEIDAYAAIGGHYVNGRGWHSLLLTRGESLVDHLPEAAQSHVLALDPLPTNRVIPVVGRSAPACLAAHLDGRRPFSGSGLQLLEGWYDPEPWGAWSRGRRCSLRLTLSAPPASGFTLVLGGHAAISPAFPELKYAVVVNGLRVATGVITLTSNGQPLKIAVPGEIAGGRSFLVELLFDEVRSPSEQGDAPDGRLLGVALRWVRANPFGFRERLRRAAIKSQRLSLAGGTMVGSAEPAPRPSEGPSSV
jgi:hypothetical protein